MHVLINHDDFRQRMLLKIAFKKAGFSVSSTGNQVTAAEYLRIGTVDLLVISERVKGRLTHSLSLLAECRNPFVSTILLTDRCDTDTDELYSLLPSLHCMLGPDVAPQMVAKLAIASVIGAKRNDEPLVLLPVHRSDSGIESAEETGHELDADTGTDTSAEAEAEAEPETEVNMGLNVVEPLFATLRRPPTQFSELVLQEFA